MTITNNEPIQVFNAILRNDNNYAAGDLKVTLLKEGNEIPTLYVPTGVSYSSNKITITYNIQDITLIDGDVFFLTLTDTNDVLLWRDKVSIKADEIDLNKRVGLYDDNLTFVQDSPVEEYTVIDSGSGTGGGDKNYIHRQSTASAVWNVSHNLAKFGSITIIDSSNNVVNGEVAFVDVNNLNITFSSAFSGKAYIN